MERRKNVMTHRFNIMDGILMRIKALIHPTRGSIGRLPSKLKAHICNEKCVRTQKEIQNVMACQFSCMNILLFIRV